MSTQIDLGPVLSIPKGDWNANTTYERLNLVRHNSAAWICNVDTSIGVEPSEDSVDWFLQVKDTSSVSSVNGMRGDVEITTIQTPSNDSNDTSIANTEWVRDRIDETIDNTHSYTDNAISTATTSILDTAAQDASNKATTAVNQALAASETKFAAKETVNDLVNNVSTLIGNDIVQNTAIAGKLDTSGGTMTGTLYVPSGAIYSSSTDNTSQVYVNGGHGWSQGAQLMLAGQNNENYPGGFQLSARNAQKYISLIGKIDGSLSWDGKYVLTSGGGNMQGILSLLGTYGDFLGKTGGAIGDNNGCLRLTGGPYKAADSGAYIHLYAKEHASKPGWIELISQNGSTSTTYVIKPDGTFTKSGYNILTSGGGTLTGQLVAALSDVIASQNNTTSTRIHGGKALNDGASIIVYGKNSTNMTGRVQLCARNGNAAENNDLVIGPNGYCALNGNTVLTSAGGTMTGDLTVPNVRVAQSSTGYSEIVGADSDAANPGPRIRLYKKNDPTYPGYMIIQGRIGSKITELQVRPNEGVYVAGQKVLTSGGGTLTGALQIAYGSQIQTNSDTTALNIYGGTGYQHGGQLVLIGRDASWLPGGFQLGARNAEKAVWLQGDINGNLTWGGNSVWTSFNGNVMNAGTVAVGNVEGSAFTLPAGGTWAYFTFTHNDVYVYSPTAGTAAGGTTIALTDKYPKTIHYFAIRIA